MRREWIEIPLMSTVLFSQMSPSMRREWIEMKTVAFTGSYNDRLPPCGGSGLKYVSWNAKSCAIGRLPPCGGSGLKYPKRGQTAAVLRLPPCGGSGLKYLQIQPVIHTPRQSPSMRREWIEMYMVGVMYRILLCLPPCGGSGLKCPDRESPAFSGLSPSMRREWIEMKSLNSWFVTT